MALRLVQDAPARGGLRLVEDAPKPKVSRTPDTSFFREPVSAGGRVGVGGEPVFNSVGATGETRLRLDEEPPAEETPEQARLKRDSAWIDETMRQFTSREGIDALHAEARAAGVPLGRAVRWKRNQLERQAKAGSLQPPETPSLSMADVNEQSTRERAGAIEFADELRGRIGQWPNTGEGEDPELFSALEVIEQYRKQVAPEVPGPRFMRQLFPREMAQQQERDPNGSWSAAGESLLQSIKQTAAGGAQALGERLRYAGNYIPAVRGLLDTPANFLRTEGYEQGAEALARMNELGAQMAPRPTASVYDDPEGWARYFGQQGVASSGLTLAGMGASLVNPALGAATFLGGAGGSEYGRARIEDGASPSEAGVRALTSVATEGIPEMLGGAAMLGRLPLMGLAQSTARGRAAIAIPTEAGTEGLTEKLNIEAERARGKYISPEEESARIKDAVVIGGMLGGGMGTGSAAIESGARSLQGMYEFAGQAADLTRQARARATTERILGRTTPPQTPQEAQTDAGAGIAEAAIQNALAARPVVSTIPQNPNTSIPTRIENANSFTSPVARADVRENDELDRLLVGALGQTDEQTGTVAAAGQSQVTRGQSPVDTTQPTQAEAAVDVAPPKPRNYRDTQFDERKHDLLDFIAMNGGLDRAAAESEGVDPAVWKAKSAENDRFFGKPAFKKGGMSIETLREKLAQSNFAPIAQGRDALDLVFDALGGREVVTPDGATWRQQQRERDENERIQRALSDLPASMRSAAEQAQMQSAIPDGDVESLALAQQAERDLVRDDILSALPSVQDQSPAQRVSAQSLGADYTDRLLSLMGARKSGAMTEAERDEYTALLEQDRETGKVNGRPMVGVGNKTGYVDALSQGRLRPVQVFTDADQFKLVNDKFGHDVGDEVIRLYGSAMIAEFGHGRVWHRGGDEFLADAETDAEADAAMARVAERMRNIRLEVPLSDGRTAVLEGIGVSYGKGATEKDADEGLKRDKERRKRLGLRADRQDADSRSVDPQPDGAWSQAGRADSRRGDGAQGAAAAAEGVAREDSSMGRDRAGSVASDGRMGLEAGNGTEQVGARGTDGRGSPDGDARSGNANASGRAGSVSAAGDRADGGSRIGAVRSAVSRALGSKFLRRLESQPWFNLVESLDQLPPDVRKSISGDDIAGFVLPDGRVFIIAENVGDNATGIVLHEVGVHFGMSGLPDFPAMLAQFKRLRAKDGAVARAYESVPKDTPAELVDEEAFAYFIEANWNAKTPLMTRIMDAVAMLLNRLGVPMSRIDDALKRQTLRGMIAKARAAAEDAAGGRISVRDGKLAYHTKSQGAPKFVPGRGVIRSGTILYHGTRGDLDPSGDAPLYLTDRKDDAAAYAAGLIPGTGKSRKGTFNVIEFAVSHYSGVLDANKRINDAVAGESEETVEDAINGAIEEARRDGYSFVWFEHPSIRGDEMNALIAVDWRMSVEPADEYEQRKRGARYSRRADGGSVGGVGDPIKSLQADLARAEAKFEPLRKRRIYDGPEWDAVEQEASRIRKELYRLTGDAYGNQPKKRQARPSDAALNAEYPSPEDVPPEVLQFEQSRSALIADATDAQRWARIVDTLRDDRLAAGPVTLYRAVMGSDDIRPGDWVTTDREYAEEHNRRWFDGRGNIVEMEVDGRDVLASPTGNYEEAVFAPRSLSGPVKDSRQAPPSEGLGASGPRYSRSTITVDGVERPTTDSTSKPIHPTDEGIRNFWRWFGDSKVVDSQGRPLVVYHGTVNDIEQFDPGRATIESDMGAGFYFTNTTAEVGPNYAGEGPDLTNRIERTAERIADAEDVDMEDAREQARKQLSQGLPNIIPAYLALANPVIVGKNGQTYFDVNEEFNEETEDYGEPTGALVDFVEAMREEAGGDRWGDIDVEQVIADVFEAANNEGLSAAELIDTIKNSEGAMYATDYESGDSGRAEFVRRSFELAGFDGVIDNTVNTKFGSQSEAQRKYGKGMAGMTPSTTHYIAFKPNQVKSATGNSGSFSPTDSRIAYSRRTPQQAQAESAQKQAELARGVGAVPGQTFAAQDRFTDDWKGTLRKAREKIQDKLLSVRDVQEDVEKVRGAVTDAMNVYRRENLMHGRVGQQRDELERTHIKPLLDAMAKAKVAPELLEDYVEARHAEERNKAIAAKQGGMPDAGAGMTTQAAADFLAGNAAGHRSGVTLTPNLTRTLDRLARRVDAITAETRQRLYQSGQITKQQLTELENAYQFYVPLRGKDGEEDAARGGTGKGIDVRGKPIQRALGRGDGNRAVNILAEVVADAERSIITAERARVGRTLARLVIENPNPDVWAIEPVKTEQAYSESADEIYMAVKNIDQDPNTIIVKVSGKPYRIYIEDTRIAEALKNLAVEQLPIAVNIMAGINRYFSAVLTRYNPAFVAVNLVRDMLFGMTGLAAEHGAKSAADAAKNYLPAMRAMWREARGTLGNSRMDRFASEFAEAGGKTYFGKLENVPDIAQRIGMEFKTARQIAINERRPLAAIGKLAKDSRMVQAIENANDAVENALRLAAYAARREAGDSVETAAEYAKNLTVNFNRRGAATSWLNALYLFFNASVQGSHRVFKLLKNRKVQAALGGLALAQAAFAMLAMGYDDEDGEPLWDSIPDWEKQRNFIIVYPYINKDGKVRATTFKIPMPYGFNIFPYLGGRTAALVNDIGNSKKHAIRDYINDSTAGVLGAMTPLPFGEEGGFKAWLPHWLRLAGMLSENKDDLGMPIRAGEQNDEYERPRAAKGRDDTSEAFKMLATALNRIGGGDDYNKPMMPWLLDWAPEDLEFIAATAGGGLSGTALKGQRMTEKLIAGVPVNFKDVPILSSFVSNVDQRQATSSRYYERKDEIERQIAQQRDIAKETGNVEDNKLGIRIARNKSGQKIKRGEGYELEGARGSLFATYKEAEKEITRIRDEMRATYRDSSIDFGERARRIDALKVEREEVQREVNAKWREVFGRKSR